MSLRDQINAKIETAMREGAQDGALLASTIIGYAQAELMPAQVMAFYHTILHVIPTQNIRDALAVREKNQPERM